MSTRQLDRSPTRRREKKSPASRPRKTQQRQLVGEVRPLGPVASFRALPAGAKPRPDSERTGFSLARVDAWLLALIAVLTGFGLVMVYSASDALGYAWYHNANYFFEHQLIGLALGLLSMTVVMRVDYHRWLSWSKLLGISIVILLLLVLLPHVGTERLGARRWFALGPLSLQPSSVATFVAIVWFARWFVDRRAVVQSFDAVRDFAVLLSGLLILVLLERDLGSTVVLAIVSIVVATLAGIRKRHLVTLVGSLGILGYLAIKLEPYRANRLVSFLHPLNDPLNTGFQATQSLLALGSGGLTGVGLGNSVQKYQWLPEAHTDFIFAIIGEELGLLGTLFVLSAFVLLAWRGIRVTLRAPDTFGALLAGGITAWICVQALINMAAVTNVAPTTGVTLPFVSYGGSSLAVTLLACGVLCNISAQGFRQGVMHRAHVDSGGRDRRPSHAGSGRRARAAI